MPGAPTEQDWAARCGLESWKVWQERGPREKFLPVRDQKVNRNASCTCRGLNTARGVPYAGLGDPSWKNGPVPQTVTPPTGQKSAAPYAVLKKRIFTVLNRLKASAIVSTWKRSVTGKSRDRRRSTVLKLSPLKVLRGSIPTRSLFPNTSPLASKPANLVK